MSSPSVSAIRSRSASRLCSAKMSWKTSASRRYEPRRASSRASGSDRPSVSATARTRKGFTPAMSSWVAADSLMVRRTRSMKLSELLAKHLRPAPAGYPPKGGCFRKCLPPRRPSDTEERAGRRRDRDGRVLPSRDADARAAPGGGGELPRLPPLRARDADRVRRGRARRGGHVRRRAARRPGGPRGQAVRRPRGPDPRPGARRGRDRPEADVRDERRQALQVAAARQAPHPPEAEL